MHTNRIILALLPLIALALSGCMAQSRVQARYMSRESDCRNEAQLRALDQQSVNAAGNSADAAAQTSYAIAASFSDCMHKEGWKVSTPKPPGAPQVPTNTAVITLPPSGAPGPGGTVATIRMPQTANATTPASPILGPGVQPQPAPAFAAQSTTVRIPSTATYAPSAVQQAPMQGSTPYGAPSYYVPSYGQGGGRQF